MSAFPEFSSLPVSAGQLSLQLAGLGFKAPADDAAALLRLVETWKNLPEHSAGTEDAEPRWFAALVRVLREAPLRDAVLTAVE